VVCICLLTPHQPRGVLGTELILAAALVGGLLLRFNRPSQRAPQEPRSGWILNRFMPSLLIPLFLAVAGLTLIADAGRGLYWITPATLVALLAGLSNTWVLLVEILR